MQTCLSPMLQMLRMLRSPRTVAGCRGLLSAATIRLAEASGAYSPAQLAYMRASSAKSPYNRRANSARPASDQCGLSFKLSHYDTVPT
jgi:hypothetical protein